MGWMARMVGHASASRGWIDLDVADTGVPDLDDALYARALVLQKDRDVATIEVQSPGMPSYRAELRSGTQPASFVGLVLRWHVPVIIDVSAPRTVILLEPPCGPDLPLASADLQTVRNARDLRTSGLAARYPPPTAAALAALMGPTASAVHPAWDAVCYRMGLMTTLEARAVLDRIRREGNDWDRAEAELYAWGPVIPEDLRKQTGAFFMHLAEVAPQGRDIDLSPFWTIGVAALMRDLSPGEVETTVFERVMRPFIEVCGPLPEQLL